MISTRRQEDNPEADWLAAALLPQSPPGLPRVALSVAIETQMRRRLRMLADLRRWQDAREEGQSHD